MEHHSLAIPYIPMQSWGALNDAATALAEGTVFPELNMPFFAAPEGSNTTLPQDADLQLQFSQICFVLDDILLYLDTHPQDEQAKQCYEEYLKKKQALKQQIYGGCACLNHYKWQEKPLVWEGGHC